MATFRFFLYFTHSLSHVNGTMKVEGARLDGKTRIGMILGTGSNAAFLERADRVHHWEGERHGEKNVIIDIEWGAFGDKGTRRMLFCSRLTDLFAFCAPSSKLQMNIPCRVVSVG